MKYFHLIWKNITRKKARAIFTLLSIIMAFTMFGVLGALQGFFAGEARFSDDYRLFIGSKAQTPLPLSYFEKIKQVHGMNPEEVTYGSMMFGYYQKPKTQFLQVAIDQESFVRATKERFIFNQQQLKDWLADHTGALVNSRLMEEFGWKLGDRIPIIVPYIEKHDGTHVWEFTIRAVYDYQDRKNNLREMFFHYDYLDQSRTTLNGTVGFYAGLVRDGEDADEVAHAIDKTFMNSANETTSGTEDSSRRTYFKRVGNINFAIMLILAAVFFTMLLVTGNSLAQAFRERIHEIAILKTLGFSGMAVLILLLAEAIIILSAGGTIGLGIAWTLVNVADEQLPNLYIKIDYFLSGILLMLVMGLLVGSIPAVQAMRLTITEALRRR